MGELEIKVADLNNKHEELSPLTDYHWERSKAAQEAVQRMLKHPYSLEQIREQIAADRIVIAGRK